MDINILRGLATVLCLLAFIAIVLWTFSSHKRKDFNDAALLPFADDHEMNNTEGREEGQNV